MREALQESDERGLKLHVGVRLLPNQFNGGGNRPLGFPMRRHIPVHVIDQRRVKGLLGGQRRADQAPDEPSQPAFQRTIDRGLAIGQDVPRQVKRRDLRSS